MVGLILMLVVRELLLLSCYLGPGYIFMTKNVKESEKIISKIST